MSDTCCAPSKPGSQPLAARACPDCGRPGRAVSFTTVQSQVALSLRELALAAYHFCGTPGCAVVYFASAAQGCAQGQSAITREQLRERVFQKESADNVLVCYCFRYSVGDIQRSDRAGRCAILADIMAGTQQGQCACELRNPQGRCCLGNVRRVAAASDVEVRDA